MKKQNKKRIDFIAYLDGMINDGALKQCWFKKYLFKNRLTKSIITIDSPTITAIKLMPLLEIESKCVRNCCTYHARLVLSLLSPFWIFSVMPQQPSSTTEGPSDVTNHLFKRLISPITGALSDVIIHQSIVDWLCYGYCSSLIARKHSPRPLLFIDTSILSFTDISFIAL